MRKIGLIVNPIAGMGGSVGLKGTDGDTFKKAIKMGAKPITPDRIRSFLSNIKTKGKFHLLVAPGNMGANIVKETGIEFEIIGDINQETTAEDTKKIAKLMKQQDIELLIFCGGDGTARDIHDAIGLSIPVVAIPSGVKMFSFDKFIKETMEIQENEVLDINEESFREGLLDSRLYGYLNVPKVINLLQAGKDSSKTGRSIEENKHEIAQHVIENLEEDTLYLLGPGTTVKAITDQLKSLLGVDALYNNKIIGIDVNERGILELLNKCVRAKIIVSPIGGQGFIFGRGNKQITPKILEKIEKKNVIIVSTEEKIKSLRCLMVDTGDDITDEMLKGLVKVIIGYKEELIIEIEC
ncbi:MAG: ATP-NAD kinase family protein [Promethearchaeota archaeon]